MRLIQKIALALYFAMLLSLAGLIVYLHWFVLPDAPPSLHVRARIITEYRVIRPDNGRWQEAIVMGVFAEQPDGFLVPVR
jgi:hypothetical protein